MTLESMSGPENSEPEKVWRLWREDIYGNLYRMPIDFDSQEEINEAHRRFTEKGHHQTYHVRQMDPEDVTEFIPAVDKQILW